MSHDRENLFLLYACLTSVFAEARERLFDMLEEGLDEDYIVEAAIMRDAAAAVSEALADSGRNLHPLRERLRTVACAEIVRTAVMCGLYTEVSGLFSVAGLASIPLKGCDPRLLEISRRPANPMQDIDILVKKADVERAGALLEKSGYRYQGVFSGSHMTWFRLDDDGPRFIEIHWDLINREHPIHGRLFTPSIDAVWKRALPAGQGFLLSDADLLAHALAHAAKEYFHKPKWLVDIAVRIDSQPESGVDSAVMKEWRVDAIYHFVRYFLGRVLPCTFSKFPRPGFAGTFIAGKLTAYDTLRRYRPLIYQAATRNTVERLRLAAGMARRAVQYIRYGE